MAWTGVGRFVNVTGVKVCRQYGFFALLTVYD